MEGQAMNLKQSRLVTKDVQKLNEFYENLTGAMAEIISSGYVELERSPCAGLAITSTAAVEVYGEGVLRSATNRSLIPDFAVKDVDAHHTRLKQRVGDWVQPPIDLPWRNRTMLLGDPDGNLINMFAVKPAPAQK
jgi:predicted enzyme related to lactoylglutathione lyase